MPAPWSTQCPAMIAALRHPFSSLVTGLPSAVMNLAVPASASIAVFAATSAPRHCRNIKRSVSMTGPSMCASVTADFAGGVIVSRRPVFPSIASDEIARSASKRAMNALLERNPAAAIIGKTQEALMSWLPTNDPVLGDAKSCDALELVVVPRTRDLGDGFEVRRALPHGRRQMVGPFIFFDHFGPVQFISGKGMDVRPHPHIGLATVTYLFDGSIMHRDSEGNVREIQPGAMNLMTAGRGIAHSERTPDVQRRDGQKMLGLQSWIALPAGSEEIAPSFQHYAAGDLPVIAERGFTARVIAGQSFGISSPVSMVSPWFYTEVTADAEVSVPLDPDHEERAIYVVDGEVEIASE